MKKSILDNIEEIEIKLLNNGFKWVIKGTDILHNKTGPALVTRDEDGNLREEWFAYDRRFRIGNPAITIIDPSSESTKIIDESYYVNDKLHREDGLAVRPTEEDSGYYIAGHNFNSKEKYELALKQWKEKGRISISSIREPSGQWIEHWIDLYGDSYRIKESDDLHREGDIAALTSNMMIAGATSIWSIDGKRHREHDLPAFRSPIGDQWYANGKLSRKGGPASKMYLKNGDVETVWSIDGAVHRDNGPAYYHTRRPTWGIIYKEYWVNGIMYSENDFDNLGSEKEDSFSWGILGASLAVAGLSSILSKNKDNKSHINQKEEVIDEVKVT